MIAATSCKLRGFQSAGHGRTLGRASCPRRAGDPLGNEVFEVDQEALAAEPGQDRVTAWEADEGGIDHLEGVDMEGLSVTARRST